jgi:hypothetical protein
LIMYYIKRYLNIKVDETFSIINNDKTEINDGSAVGKVVGVNEESVKKLYSDIVGD